MRYIEYTGIMSSPIRLYIDTKCLVCHAFWRQTLLHIQPDVELIDINSLFEDKHTLLKQWFDLDNGFLLQIWESYYQWIDALRLLNAILVEESEQKRTWFHIVLWHDIFRRLGFKLGRFLRKGLQMLQWPHWLIINSSCMKGKACSVKGKCCPSKCLLHFVFGGTMALYGLGKLLGGPTSWEMVGNMGLGLFGLNAEGSILALVLGLLVALIEFVGGLSFAAKCHKTSVISAKLLSIVMFVALFVHIKKIDISDVSGYEIVTTVLDGIQAPMLYGTVFLAYAIAHCKSKCASKCSDDAKCEDKKECCDSSCKDGACDVKSEKKKK